MSLSGGQVLQNRYRIVALLGEGGMGAVYRAWHIGLEKPVALKEMLPQPGLDEPTLGQFRAAVPAGGRDPGEAEAPVSRACDGLFRGSR